jgi:hypothetical protein
MSFRRNGLTVIAGRKVFRNMILIFFILLIGVSCATQHKFKKKAEPCPCEKTNRR